MHGPAGMPSETGLLACRPKRRERTLPPDARACRDAVRDGPAGMPSETAGADASAGCTGLLGCRPRRACWDAVRDGPAGMPSKTAGVDASAGCTGLLACRPRWARWDAVRDGGSGRFRRMHGPAGMPSETAGADASTRCMGLLRCRSKRRERTLPPDARACWDAVRNGGSGRFPRMRGPVGMPSEMAGVDASAGCTGLLACRPRRRERTLLPDAEDRKRARPVGRARWGLDCSNWASAHQYMPPPISGAAGAAAGGVGMSATRLSVVSTMAATEAAFCRALLVTLVGSMIPFSSMEP